MTRKKKIITLGLTIITILLLCVALRFLKHEIAQNKNLAELNQRMNNIEAVNANLSVNGVESYSFDLSDNDLFHGDASGGEMGDYKICFVGQIDNFSEIHIGKGIDGEAWGYFLSVDNQNITICDTQMGSVVAQYPHNMMFKDYLGVNVLADLKGTAIIEVSTNGGSFRQENVPWLGVNGTLFAQTVGETTLKDCTLSYYCNGWKKDIWLFGDSYFSMTEKDRWTTYLVENESKNIMLNAYSGKKSQAALTSLKNELCYGTPKKIIWCMGMNDGDSESEANPEWIAVTEELMSICSQKNIELILTTIPTNPYWYNDFKNEYVKSSGYKYIDFANIVGAYDNIEWNDNMLEEGENRIHPTEDGAIALYHQAVSTVPELLER